jgi:hypothetical protein
MWKKFLRLEDKIFSAPYKWFVKKGIVTVIETSKKVFMTMEDLYESLYDEEYKGNPNWAGDD